MIRIRVKDKKTKNLRMDLSFEMDDFFDVFSRTAAVCSAMGIAAFETLFGRPAVKKSNLLSFLKTPCL